MTDRPKWTVFYTHTLPDNRWASTNWEFFDDKEKAHQRYEFLNSISGFCVTVRPYHHATDYEHLAACHRSYSACPGAFVSPEASRDDLEVEQLRVQLAGVLTAAEGGISDEVVAKEGQYGWSPAYQAVVELRRKYDDIIRHFTCFPMIRIDVSPLKLALDNAAVADAITKAQQMSFVNNVMPSNGEILERTLREKWISQGDNSVRVEHDFRDGKPEEKKINFREFF